MEAAPDFHTEAEAGGPPLIPRPLTPTQFHTHLGEVGGETEAAECPRCTRSPHSLLWSLKIPFLPRPLLFFEVPHQLK